MSDCVALKAYGYSPGSIGPTDRPSGWPPSSATDPAPKIVEQALRCSRIHVGPFERGPIHLLLEWHVDAQAPAACLEGQAGPRETRILATALLDDPEVAAHLKDEYGLPALAADFTQDEAALGPAWLHTWTWRLGSDPASEIRMESDAVGVSLEWQDRLFWASGDGVAFLDVAWSGNHSQAVRPAQGSFQSPLLMARAANGAFAGLGEWLPSLEGQGTFTVYRDLQCEEAQG